MKLLTLRELFPLLACLTLLVPTSGYSRDSLAYVKLHYFLEIAEDLFKKAEIPGAGMAIVYNGEIMHTGGFGYLNVEQSRPVTDSTLFIIGSTTKAFTGLAAAKMVEKGLLDWKRPIIHYLPEFTLSEPYVAQHINLEDLFTHMSGLAAKDELWLGKNISREAVYQQTATLPFAHSFRSSWGYNNHAYVIIGKVIETVAGKSWEEIIQEEILVPLKMNNTQLTHADFLQNADHVTGYFGDGKTVKPHINTDNIAPAGGISSTPKDMAKWIQMLANSGQGQDKPLLTKDAYDYLTTPKRMSFTDTCSVRYYSIGWGGSMTAGDRTLRHNGAMAGNNARVSVMPDDGFGIFIMTNQRSDYKDILTDYGESIFVHGDFQRDTKREAKLINLNRFFQFQNKLLDFGIEEARAYHATLAYKDFEANMIALGQSLLTAGYSPMALFVFELTAADHPNSYLAHYHYGRALALNKEKTKAVAAFKKALAINPAAETVKEALKQLLSER
ncbi:MAG: serine hydrolase [Bacteroidota bacterium]